MAYKRALRKDRPIFISCSTKDIETARFLRSAIHQLPRFWGYIARDEPKHFEYPSEKVASMLEVSSAYIVIYTPHVAQSPMTNQELGFFFNRWRKERGASPILLVKSNEIIGEIEGFAYGREPILFDPSFPEEMVSETLWNLRDIFSIKELEIRCSDHIQQVNWPDAELCRKCISSNQPLDVIGGCSACGAKIHLNPSTFLPIPET